MKLTLPNDKDEIFFDRLENGSSTSQNMVLTIAGKRLAVRVMASGAQSDQLVDAATDCLLKCVNQS